MGLSEEERSSLQSLAHSGRYDGSVAARAQMVLWEADGHSVAQIAAMAGATRPTVYKWLGRYKTSGVAGLVSGKSPGGPQRVSGRVRARILALTRQTPPVETGLTHWSSREMAKYLNRREEIPVSHNFIASLWRANNLQPHQVGTFKLSTDSDFEAKVFDVVGLYLDPPDGAVVLSYDEKTQVQALDRTQPCFLSILIRQRSGPMTTSGTVQQTSSLRWILKPARSRLTVFLGVVRSSSSRSWTE